MKNKKIIQVLNDTISILNIEITWCENHPDLVSSEQHKWFIIGIEQSVFLISGMIAHISDEDFAYEKSPFITAIETAKALKAMADWNKGYFHDR
jgi:hypothetical protein